MSKSSVDQELIRQLAALLKETELCEIEVETDGLKVRVARQIIQHATLAPAPNMPASPAGGTQAEPAAHPGGVLSPMVGTAYTAPEPGAAPFVQVGARVEKGQPVLIIEAMKTMNHIPAPHAGTVTRILVEDGQPVEFAEPLMIIE